jgi:hypothetical protein
MTAMTVEQARALDLSAYVKFLFGCESYRKLQLQQAVSDWHAALADYQALIDAGHGQYREGAATTRGNLGIALSDAGQLPEAMVQYQAALADYQALIDAGQGQYRAGAARTRSNLGTALSRGGQLREAMEQYHAALDVYSVMIEAGQRMYLADSASIRGNMGIALFLEGQLRKAIDCYYAGLGEYQALIQAGHDKYGPAEAGLRANLGLALSHDGQLRESMAQHQLALSCYQSLIDAGNDQFRADALMIRGNMGITLSLGDEHLAARAQHEAALFGYLVLIEAGQEQYRAEAARTQGNLAKSFWRTDQLHEAMELNHAALANYQALIDAGQRQYLSNAANIQTSLGFTLSNEGQLLQASEQYHAALDTYEFLVEQGQRRYSEQLPNVANNLAVVALRQLIASIYALENDTRTRGTLQKKTAWRNTCMLCRTPVHAQAGSLQARSVLQNAIEKLSVTRLLVGDVSALGVLQRTLHTLTQCQKAQAALQTAMPTLAQDMAAVADVWLNQAAHLLAHGQPRFLNTRFESNIAPMLQAVLGMLIEWNDAAAVANWHLRTQGLRAQRQAVAAGASSDEDLQKLDALYNRIEALDGQIHGQYMAGNLLLGQPGPNRLRWFAGQAESFARDESALMQSKLLERDRLWDTELQPLLQRLERLGKLPGNQFLRLADVAEKLQANATLVLLMPAADGQLAAVCVQTKAADALNASKYKASLHRVALAVDSTTLWAQVDSLTRHASHGLRSVRGLQDEAQTAAAGAVTAPAVLTTAELAAVRSAWLAAPRALQPLLVQLRAQGMDEVHIVPSGDLHLAAWAGSLDELVPGLRVRQFPTTAGWWRVMGDAGTPAPTRWASLAFDAADTPKELVWVGAEVRALQRIWAGAGATADAAAPVQVLDPLAPALAAAWCRR